MGFFDFIVQLLSNAAILVGLIALVGLLAQRKPFEQVVSGTLKTVIGFIILGGGAGIVINAILPLGDLLTAGFGLQGALPVNEVFVALAQERWRRSGSGSRSRSSSRSPFWLTLLLPDFPHGNTYSSPGTTSSSWLPLPSACSV